MMVVVFGGAFVFLRTRKRTIKKIRVREKSDTLEIYEEDIPYLTIIDGVDEKKQILDAILGTKHKLRCCDAASVCRGCGSDERDCIRKKRYKYNR